MVLNVVPSGGWCLGRDPGGDCDDGADGGDGDDRGDGVDGDDGDMIHNADVLCKEVTFHLGSNFKLDRGGIANNIGTSQIVMIFTDIMVIQMKRRRVKCE